MNNKEVTKSALYNKLNNTDKVLFILYDYPNISQESLLQNRCYPVTSVTSVTSVTPNPVNKKQKKIGTGGEGNNSNTSNTSNRVTGVLETTSEDKNKLKVTINRLVKRGYILKDESVKPFNYSLSVSGENYVEDKIKTYNDEINKIVEKEEKKSLHERLIEGFTSYIESNLSNYINELNKNGFFSIDLKDLSSYDPELLSELIDNTVVTNSYIKAVVKDLDFFRDEKPYVFINAPECINKNITHLRSKDLDTLRCIVGEIRSRSQSSIKVTTSFYECPSCGNRITVMQVTNHIKEPKMCGCGRKGKFRLLKNEVIDTLKITVNDLYENLNSNQVPEEINVFLDEDKFKFSTLKEGDRVRLIGVLTLNPLYVNGKESTEMIKVFTCYGIEKLEDDYDKIFITSDDEEKLKEISKDPIKFHQEKLFNDLHDVDLAAKFAVLGMYGRLNLLFCGTPGCGKSQIQERISKVALRGSFVNCITASQSGIVGSVNKNPFTGKWSIDGGILRPMHPQGLSVLDEINRDGEGHNIQRTVLDIMSSQTLRITKAGNRLEYPCDVSIWASVNPLGSYNLNVDDNNNFGIIKPLWDRFDFKIFFNNVLDWTDTDLVVNLLSKNKSSWSIPDEDLLLIRKYQIRSKLINVEFSKDDLKKLGVLAQELVKKIDPNSSYRRLPTMRKLLEAICKLHLRSKPVNDDFVFLSNVIVDSVDSKFFFDRRMNDSVSSNKQDFSEVLV